MWGNRKYKLILDEKFLVKELQPDYDDYAAPWRDTFYRLQALRDIPEHGVKAGDLGGLVSNTNKRNILSHEGSCWIGYHARVAGRVYITDDVYIGDDALVFNSLRNRKMKLSGSVSVMGEAELRNEGYGDKDIEISGNVKIFEEAVVLNPLSISGQVKIHGKSFTMAKRITDTVEIAGYSAIQPGAVISGNSKILDSCEVREDTKLHNVILRGATKIAEGKRLEDIEYNNNAITDARSKNSLVSGQSQPKEIAMPNSEKSEAQEEAEQAFMLFNELNESIASYETDIVKIIKYPAMTDRTDVFTREMVKAHGKAKRLISTPNSDKFIKAVAYLEDAFLAAESNAIRLASTMLSVEDLKKTKDAKVMLAKASDEASSETEKKVAFKQAFKQLEGVITVPEVAVDAFRVKIGLKEIEA